MRLEWFACRLFHMPSTFNLKTEDVAARLALSEWGVRRLVRSGRLRAINTASGGRRIFRFSEEDVTAFAKANRVAA